MSKKRIAKFLNLLRQKPSIFANCTQVTWEELNRKLAQLGEEDYEDIEDVILDWLDDHDYDVIKIALQTLKKDPLDDNEVPPAPSESEQPITNTALRSAIRDIQNQNH